MKDKIEIRWHGRGGQGTKTAALMLADLAAEVGKFVQGFPEYGPERMGAPMKAYTRISDREVRVHSCVYEPDCVVVVDGALIKDIDVSEGLKKDGLVIINSNRSVEELRKDLGNYEGKLYVLDADRISLENIGRKIPNTPMLTAVLKGMGVMDDETIISEMRRSLEKKFSGKPAVIEANVKAVEQTLKEVN